MSGDGKNEYEYCEDCVKKGTLARADNKPGQPELKYRLGTYGTFMRQMASLIHGYPALSGLTVRTHDDPSIALLDAWAMVADVLAFYQERIANEGFLRTATERRSVLELAREVGYELKPGVAAGTYLAFTVEDTVDPDAIVAIPKGTKVQSIPPQDKLPQTFETDFDMAARAEWNALKPRLTVPGRIESIPLEGLGIKGISTGLRPGDVLLFTDRAAGWWSSTNFWDFRVIKTVSTDPVAVRTNVVFVDGVGRQSPGQAQNSLYVYVFRQKAALFGHNAPDWRAMPADVKKAYLNLDPNAPIPQDKANMVEWETLNIPDISGTSLIIHVDPANPLASSGGWLMLSVPGYQMLYVIDSASEKSKKGFTLTAKTTRLTLKAGDLSNFNDRVRDTAAYVQSEQLELADAPLTEIMERNNVEVTGMADGIYNGQTVVVWGQDKDGLPAGEVAIIKETERDDDGTRPILTFEDDLENDYERKSVTIYANVVHATHGETVSEVLGSGNAAIGGQRFTLKKRPLTYVHAPSGDGAKSTLEVRIDNVRWDETTSLFDKGEGDRDYIVRIDNDQKAEIIFGDGVHGARLPSGVENALAVYRNGIGMDGEVEAGSLTLLQARPPGVREVTNPLPATGAADPEKLEDARKNAPLMALTMGRIVSLRDFEDFARRYAGIGKSRAIVLWDGKTDVVCLTVGSSEGGAVADYDLKTLRDSVDSARDPIRKAIIDTYEPLFFTVNASLRYDPSYLEPDIKKTVEAALKDTFSFEKRSFGQNVAASEAVNVIQGVPGVLGVSLTLECPGQVAEAGWDEARHKAVGNSGGEAPELAARKAGFDKGFQRPQLLLIDPDGIVLEADNGGQ